MSGRLCLAAAAVLMACGCASRPLVRLGLEPAASQMTADELVRYTDAEGLLESREPEAREQAAIALLSMGHSAPLQAVLARMTGASDPVVRASMIKAAAFCEDHRCFEAVLAAVKDPDEGVQDAAASAISSFSRPLEVEAIIALVADGSATPRQRQLLFRAIGEGLLLQAAPVLLEGLNNEDPAVRTAAWKALKGISGRDFPPDRQRWNQWWEAYQHKSREDILQERIRSLTLELEAAQREERGLRNQLDELGSLVRSPASQASERLLKALSSEYPAVRAYAIFRLASLGPDAFAAVSLEDEETYKALAAALRDKDPEAREKAVQLLANLKGEARNRLVLQALQDESPAVLVKALEAVSRDMGDPAVDKIGAVLASPYPQVREAAANALGKLGSERAVAPLLGALGDREDNVRWFAVESLRKLGATGAVPYLCELVQKDPSPRVREIAASALGELGQPAAVPALRKALEDANDRVRTRAVSALQALARDDLERMMVIADALAEGGHSAAARDVLRKAIADFGNRAEQQARLIVVREKLAEALKAQKDFAGAGGVYLQLDELTGGSLKVRDQLIDCWLAGGEPGRIVPALTGWLQNAAEGSARDLIDLGCATVQKLAESKNDKLAADLVEVLLNAARPVNDDKLTERVQQLKAAILPQAGGEPEPVPPAP